MKAIPNKLLFLFMLFHCTGQAQLEDYSFEQLPKFDIQWYFQNMVEDRHGFLWASSTDQLYRFDGLDYDVFSHDPLVKNSIPSGRNYSLCMGIDDNLWIGSHSGGLARININTFEIKAYRHDPTDSTSISGDVIIGLLAEPDGGMWVSTDNFTLSYLPPGSEHFLKYQAPLPQDIEDVLDAGVLGAIVQDLHNPSLLWIGSRFGIYQFSKATKSFSFFPFDEVLVQSYKPYPINMFTDPITGDIWFSYNGLGAGRVNFDTKKLEFNRKYAKEVSLESMDYVNSFFPINQEYLIATTNEDGIWLINRATKEVLFNNKFSERRDIKRVSPLRGLLQDKRGDIWCKGEKDVFRLSNKRFLINSIGMPKTYRYNFQRAHLHTKFQERNCIYIATLYGDGLLRFDIADRHFEALPYFGVEDWRDLYMDELCEDGSGRIWIGTNEGLLYYVPGEERVEGFHYNGADSVFLKNSYLNGLVLEAGNLWIGTHKHGLFCLDIATEKLKQLPETLIKFFKPLRIQKLFVDKENRMWVGTSRGLYSLHLQNLDGPPLLHKAGINVSDIDADSFGNIWCSTFGQGLYEIRQPFENEADVIPHINYVNAGGNYIYEFAIDRQGDLWLQTDGNPNRFETSTNIFYPLEGTGIGNRSSISIGEDGIIYRGAHRSIFYFDPENIDSFLVAPVPYIRTVKVGDGKKQMRPFTDTTAIQITYADSRFEIEPGALNFNKEAKTNFTYRLNGFDTEWLRLGKHNVITYTNIPPGEYTFELNAASKFGQQAKAYYQMAIVVASPFWQQLWFRLLAGLLVILSVWQVYLFQKRNEQSRRIRSTINYFATSTYRNFTVDEILWDMVRNVISSLNFEDCVVYLYDNEQKLLVQRAAYGPKNPDERMIANPIDIPLGSGIVGTVAVNRKAEIIADTSRDPRYISDDAVRNSEIAVPILHDEKLIGIIDSEHKNKNFYSQAHLDALTQIAALCSNKIVGAQAQELAKEKERELLEINKQVAEAKLVALRAQMNPHFIFNSLNSINYYILKNQSRPASAYLTKFSKLMRLILDNSQKPMIELSQELEALRLYLEMESIRFEDRFVYRIEMDEELTDATVEVPPLILQPFAENAIHHGFLTKEGLGKLSIRLYRKGKLLLCQIEDNGIGRRAASMLRKSNSKRQSKGLDITADRIRLAFQNGPAANPVKIIDLVDEAGQAAGTLVEIQLPLY